MLSATYTGSKGSGYIRIAIVSAVLLGVNTSAWARYEPPPPCRNMFTHDQEVAAGAKVAAQVYQQMPVLPESDPVSRYVVQLGQRLVQHAPGGPTAWPYSFHVVASEDINAFALPGGAMFVNLGAVQAAEQEAPDSPSSRPYAIAHWLPALACRQPRRWQV